jgi:acetolactate synthase-1/2/3 large subunit
LANLHNGRRAETPIVNVVGDHATYHTQYDAPLGSDLAGFAQPVSGWIRASRSAQHPLCLRAASSMLVPLFK